ncbi:MAG: GFA family protein [Hyphomicrobiaceae bacterium]|nr:GFA family protein [Hyphomicrobiaceae bacterium]
MHEIDAEGGCRCGAIRYRASGKVFGQATCHCRDCQYASGGAPAYVFVMNKNAVQITKGVPAHFDSLADSGNRRRRYFCGTCGTPIFAEDSGFPDIVSVKAGSLDDPSLYKPAAEFWLSSAPPWHPIDSSLPGFDKGPK